MKLAFYVLKTLTGSRVTMSLWAVYRVKLGLLGCSLGLVLASGGLWFKKKWCVIIKEKRIEKKKINETKKFLDQTRVKSCCDESG